MLRGVVTSTSSGLPCMAKYPLVIDREQAMINAIEAKLATKPDCSMTVPFRAFRILVGGTIPFRSVPFRILVTTRRHPFPWPAGPGPRLSVACCSTYPRG